MTLTLFFKLSALYSPLSCARRFFSLVWPTAIGRAYKHISLLWLWKSDRSSQRHWHPCFPFSIVPLPEQAHSHSMPESASKRPWKVQCSQHIAETTPSAWRYITRYPAGRPCCALTEVPVTQRGVFFLFSSLCFKGIKYRGHNIFWPCCNCGFPPVIAHMIMELCNNIRGVWKNLWPIKSLKQCSKSLG